MAANTIMMYFRLDKASLSIKETVEKLTNVGEICLGELAGAPIDVSMGDTERLMLFHGKDKSHAVMHVYSHGLMTLDIEHYVGDVNNPPQTAVAAQVAELFSEVGKSIQLSESYITALEHTLGNHFGKICIESKCLFSPIRRGEPVWQYNTTSDSRLLETDYDQVVYEMDSPWQNICIMHSKQHGNVLYLDSDIMRIETSARPRPQNLLAIRPWFSRSLKTHQTPCQTHIIVIGERDLIYTQTLCCIGQESYRNKEILILGGGDGGILHQLLKEDPKFVTMAEIDEQVIKACRLYLREVCQDSMDQLEGVNYKILLEDCVKVLQDTIAIGKWYDYVINDLTEYTIDKPLNGVLTHDLATSSQVTKLALKVVKPGGKLLARGNTTAEQRYHQHMEGDLKVLGCDFIRREVLVPSYRELYSFYEIWKPQK